MAVDVKFCGLTRAEDAASAVRLGARYAGVVFADGPRRLSTEAARQVLLGATGGVRRVGVFALASAQEIGRTACHLALDVVQLHGDPDASAVAAVRACFDGEVWAVIRTAGPVPSASEWAFETADGVVLDARVRGSLGGTGSRFDWTAAAPRVAALRDRGRARLVLAGGLSAENVADAIAALRPDVVDVSSGVECAPGVKDPAKMRAFADAVRATTAEP